MIDSDSADSILAVPALVASLDSSDANTESTKSTLTKRRRIVVPVLLDPLPAPPTRFTADWIVSSQSHTRFLSSVATMSADRNAIVYSVNAIAILPIRIPFPPSKSSSSTDSTDDASADGIRKEEEVPIPIEDGPDSTLFIFPPRALSERLGTATALQVANGTFACPDGYCERLSLTYTLSCIELNSRLGKFIRCYLPFRSAPFSFVRFRFRRVTIITLSIRFILAYLVYTHHSSVDIVSFHHFIPFPHLSSPQYSRDIFFAITGEYTSFG